MLRFDDLLVIGGSGMRRLTGRRRARVARRCSREAACPVVVVPPPAIARRPVARLAKDVVREADTLLMSATVPPVTLPPEPDTGSPHPGDEPVISHPTRQR